jgi:GNAT superfamily N-acetyltransferase
VNNVSEVTYRELQAVDLPHMSAIDRQESIDGQYTADHGNLTFHERRIEVAGWYPTEIPDHVAHLEAFIAGGGTAFGAWDGDTMVGIAGLSAEPVGGDPAVMQLEPLNVSALYRNRGIGGTLVRLIAEAAKARGARALYISSIPTRNSVDAYIRMGAHVLASPDPELFALQPEDIHLLLPIVPSGA